jgi:nucleotide-binding universal stress UspA family protein
MEETTMPPLKTIVIATSLTDASDGIVRTGAALARVTGASPWLVHNYIPYFPMTFPAGAGLDAQWVEEQAKGLRERSLEQARRTGLSALPGFSPEQIRLTIGSPHREIVELAYRVKADLIVMGAAESAHRALGSTADRVIRKAPCPVFAVRPEAAFPPIRVEIPVDFSPASANALREGLDLLDHLGVPHGGTEVLFVLNPFEVGGSIHFNPEQVHRFAEEELHRFLDANLGEDTRPFTRRVRTGYAREEILAAIQESHADLAVIGTHGRSGFERLMLGSVAAGVLHGARCNLLVVPPGASLRQDPAMLREEMEGADWNYISDEAPVAAGHS